MSFRFFLIFIWIFNMYIDKCLDVKKLELDSDQKSIMLHLKRCFLIFNVLFK